MRVHRRGGDVGRQETPSSLPSMPLFARPKSEGLVAPTMYVGWGAKPQKIEPLGISQSHSMVARLWGRGKQTPLHKTEHTRPQ